MEDYLGPVKSKPELFLKLVKKVSRPEYTMHFMEDRNGRKAMFYNYKGVKIEEGECALLKGTISEHRRSCLLYTSPSPRDLSTSRMPSSA